MKRLSSYRFPPNNTYKRRQKNSITNLDDYSHRKRNVKRPEMTSKDLKRPQLTPKESSPNIARV